MKTLAVFTGLLCVLTTASSLAHDIIRHASPSTRVTSSVSVPAGSDLLFVSGMFATWPIPPRRPQHRAIRRHGGADEERARQAREGARGGGLLDGGRREDERVLVGDPRKGGAMDFDGLMKASLQFHGLAIRSQNHPARTTVQVAVSDPRSALVAIEACRRRVTRRTDPGAYGRSCGGRFFCHQPLNADSPRSGRSCR